MEATKKFDDTNRWVLFRNKEKKAENSPDYSGTVNIDGVEFLINGWVKEGETQKFFSGTVRPKTGIIKNIVPDLDVPF